MNKLRLNRELFSNQSIERTMQTYKRYATMTVSYDAHYVTVTFRKCKYDAEQTVKEFENYLIGVENAKHGVSA